VATAYFRHPVTGATSPGGRHLATLVHKAVFGALGGADRGTAGMGVAILRETRMPAVICEFGPTGTVVERLGPLAVAITAAVAAWAAAPYE
jgi:N-acetylmuramoyl-L-alanine amidase